MTQQTLHNPADITFTASESISLATTAMQNMATNKSRGVSWTTEKLDEYIMKPRGGMLVGICARPGNFKSGLIRAIALQEMQTIQELQEDITDRKAVIMMTWEESVETLASYWLSAFSGIDITKMMRGEVSMDELLRLEEVGDSITKVGTLPFYIVGYSTTDSGQKRKTRPRLSTSVAESALDYLLNDLDVVPSMVSMDYLQRMHYEVGFRGQRHEHFSDAVDWVKDMTIMCDAPVYLATQAKESVDDKAVAIPDQGDSQYTSNLGQSCDIFIGSHLPKKKGLLGEYFSYQDINIPSVKEDDLIIKVDKQKGGRSGKAFHLKALHGQVKIRDVEVTDYEIKDYEHGGSKSEKWGRY